MTSALFSPIRLGSQTFRNRVFLPPMCTYSAREGLVDDWHLMHYGSLAAGGFGLVIAEATAVAPRARITPRDAGLWNEEQVSAWARVVDCVHARGGAIAVQIGHAGRKASTYWPWSERRGSVPPGKGGWVPLGVSPEPFPTYDPPQPADLGDVEKVVDQFAAAARRAALAGFDALEVHAAHGYLIHQFLSPLTNSRTDAYGGDLGGRARLLMEVVGAVRAVWPVDRALLVRLSATDWIDGGWDLEQTCAVSAWLRELGVDLIDVSSGQLVPAPVPYGPGYQVHLARAVRAQAAVATSAVGFITSAAQAEQIVAEESADVVQIGRAALSDPHWPLHAARELGVDPSRIPWIEQYRSATHTWY